MAGLVLFAAMASFAISGCGSSDDGLPTGNSDGSNASFSFLNGTWVGTWTDTRYNVSGSLRAVITVTGSTVTATGTIGLQSLGLGNENGTASGTVSGQTLSFQFAASTVGVGTGTLTAGAGNGSGSGTVTGVLNLGGFTYTGTATATTINGTFRFTSATGGNGVATLTKQ